ncbi:hypothetical protein QBC34DRAFT_382535 [Podospora aff. communis PSN243]|uniref:Uncharacterized protein n=1 Tax=Podospora aff. communis PSN243 TaxID=3040156 RepID=A0AAV9GHA5_9PEZI|nr:hypothetical protein QBC34DRAFT_382535 [Podospora aff. communis PSN243]
MRTAIFATVLALATGAFAGLNCKCQDSRGQFNSATEYCCGQYGGALGYFPGPNNQCANPANGIDSGGFDKCCRSLGVDGSFCWA